MRVDFEWRRAGTCRHPEFMTLSGGKLRPVSFPSCFGKIRHPSEGWILFDTGYSEHFHAETQHFPEKLYHWMTPVSCEPAQSAAQQLRAEGLDPAEIRWIIISHFHADHVAGLKDFPNARFFCMRSAFDALAARSRLRNLSQGYLPKLLPPDFLQRLVDMESRPLSPLPPHWKPFEQAYDLFADQSLMAVPLNGHALGQIGLILQSQTGKDIFLVADAVWNSESFRSLKGPHPLSQVLSHDPAAYKKTLHRLHQLYLHHSEALLLPSHCREPSEGLL